MKKYSIRSIFIAPPDKLLVSADLSQAESWIVAYLSQDENMIWSLNNSDIHTDTAAALFFDSFCQHDWKKQGDEYHCKKGCGTVIVKTARYIGKRYNHASAYRMKPPRAAQVINKDSDKPPYVVVALSESKLYSEKWHARYPRVSKFWWPDIEQKLNATRSITTAYGRTRTFFAQWGDELFKEATAFEPQSTVADHANGAMQKELGIPGGIAEVRRRLILPYKDRKIINQSHDSFLAEVPKQDAKDFAIESKAIMQRPLIVKGREFTIPSDAEMGERYGELEKVA